MTEQRRRIRYEVKFPAILSGHHAETGIVYDLGLGGCKMISQRVVKSGSLISVHLSIPKHTIPISIHIATVQ